MPRVPTVLPQPELVEEAYVVRPAGGGQPETMLAAHRWRITTAHQTVTITYISAGPGQPAGAHPAMPATTAAKRFTQLVRPWTTSHPPLTLAEATQAYKRITGFEYASCHKCHKQLLPGAFYCTAAGCGAEVPRRAPARPAPAADALPI